ncbi:hypothetical protein K438DRAFT_1832445 [Mycena galopus ATCC 62051]|nr:hypothetical protein K438DRAFT_1832445 [Mycena galopus ATCC 62051]
MDGCGAGPGPGFPSSIISPSVLRARLTEIDEEMDALEARLRSLAAERRQVVDGLNLIVYPVLSLPPEITSKIFTHYVHDPNIGRWRRCIPGRGPLTLASVCRSWRGICFSTRPLWASLRIYPARSWVMDDFLHLLKCWLQRAGNHPLDLQLFECGPGSTMTVKIFSVISHYSSQIRTLAFSLDAPFSFPNPEIVGRLPLLTKLAVNILAEHDSPPVLTTAFSNAPRLREVRLSGASLQWITLPWIQLTHLEFSDESVSKCLQVLKDTSNLEVLEIYLPSMDMEPLPPQHLTLPHLHTLKFSYDREGRLLERLVLPALKTIHLTSLEGEGLSRLRSLCVRSECSLDSVHLAGMSTDSSTRCLRSLPSVTKVELQGQFDHALSNKLVEVLYESRTFLPALHTLTLRECGTEISPSLLAAMLASRSSGAPEEMAKLESFRLFFSRNAPHEYVEDTRALLRPLIDAGLEVFIESS